MEYVYFHNTLSCNVVMETDGYFSLCPVPFLFLVDDRFPPDATVEFIFSSGPEKIKGK